MKVQDPVTDPEALIRKPFRRRGTYFPIWEKVEKLKRSEWLPIQFKSKADLVNLRCSAQTHRTLPMNVCCRGLTLYLRPDFGTKGRYNKKLGFKIKNPIRDLTTYPERHMWADVWKKARKLKDGEWLPIELPSRRDCLALKSSVYRHSKPPLSATVKGNTVFLRRSSKEQIALIKSATASQGEV